MNAKERYLAVYDEDKRKTLDRVPTFVQYIKEDFIALHKDILLEKYQSKLFNNLYFDIPLIFGFDSIFASMTTSYKVRRVTVRDNEGNRVKIGIDGQTRRKSTYYEGGFIQSLDTLNDLRANLKIVNRSTQIVQMAEYFESLSPYIFPVPTLDGIFDKVWQAMGFSLFSREFRKKTKLYQELIKFYAEIIEINLEGIIEATKGRLNIINILDDVAFKGRPMISPASWERDFMPYYKKITAIISDAGMISQTHTDGDVTQLVPSLQKAGFRGLQGWEGGADPYFINDNYPDFVIVGFGDVSEILPFGSSSQIQNHVKTLMDALKENRHFILGPSTVIVKEMPLENIQAFMNAAKKYGNY